MSSSSASFEGSLTSGARAVRNRSFRTERIFIGSKQAHQESAGPTRALALTFQYFLGSAKSVAVMPKSLMRKDQSWFAECSFWVNHVSAIAEMLVLTRN